jgi:hypothetical protein
VSHDHELLLFGMILGAAVWWVGANARRVHRRALAAVEVYPMRATLYMRKVFKLRIPIGMALLRLALAVLGAKLEPDT